MRAKLHRRFLGQVGTVTIVKEPSGKYYACVTVNTDEAPPMPDSISADRTAGIDAGIKTAFTVAKPDGSFIECPNSQFLREVLDRLAVEQRKLSRKEVKEKEALNKKGEPYLKKGSVEKLFKAKGNRGSDARKGSSLPK